MSFWHDYETDDHDWGNDEPDPLYNIDSDDDYEDLYHDDSDDNDEHVQLEPKSSGKKIPIPKSVKVLTFNGSESNSGNSECSKAEETSEDDSKPASSDETFEIPKPVKVERKDDFLIDLLNSFSENTDEFTEMIKNGNVYELKELSSSDSDYGRTKSTFDASMQSGTQSKCRGYRVKKIEKVLCPYLVAQFKLREERKRAVENSVFEQEVYHGTKKANIASICKENFDWRKSGTHFGTKFGCGVSFAKYPTRATFYPKVVECPRGMLVTKIIYVKKQIGRTGMRVPDDNYDTTTCDKDEVIVKYDDAEFLPLFVIYYS